MERKIKVQTMAHGEVETTTPVEAVQIWNAGQWHTFDVAKDQEHVDTIYGWLNTKNKRIVRLM